MKKCISMILMLGALVGCEEATKAIDKAQEAANSAVDSVQEKMESVDLEKLNLDQFGEAAQAGQNLMQSLEAAMEADFTNQEALTHVKERLANAYTCLVDATSESSADKIMDQFMSTISREEVKSFIDSSVQKAKETQECIMK